MILDAENIFSLRQSLVAGVGNVLSTQWIDLGVAGALPVGYNARGNAPHDVGKGMELEVECQLNTTVTSGGAATLTAQLCMADDDIGTNLVVLAQTAAIALATMVKGYRFAIASTVPAGVSSRYLGVRYVIATAAITAGTVTAALTFPGAKQTA
jgi:hypothetical protein